MTAYKPPLRCDAEPQIPNELQPHQLASAADPRVPIRRLAERRAKG